MGSGIANLDSLDFDRERRRARQHKLIRDVEAPVCAPHGARAREHRRREPRELLPGSILATWWLGSAAVLACAEVDMHATAISTVNRTASRRLRCPDTRATGSAVTFSPSAIREVCALYYGAIRPLSAQGNTPPVRRHPSWESTEWQRLRSLALFRMLEVPQFVEAQHLREVSHLRWRLRGSASRSRSPILRPGRCQR